MIRKLWHAIGKRWGSVSTKQRIWDAEYKAGRWTYDRSGPNNESREPIYGFLERYGRDGAILDLGCGSGMTALEMKPNFQEYVGVDISDLAIERARATLNKESDRADRVRFFVDDIVSFVPAAEFSIILFRESIMYIPQHRIEGMLRRYCSYLRPGGLFLIRICDTNRFRGIIQILKSNLQVSETFVPGGDSTMAIFVCVPAQDRRSGALSENPAT
jgi:SAM-dependent methyltransferase